MVSKDQEIALLKAQLSRHTSGLQLQKYLMTCLAAAQEKIKGAPRRGASNGQHTHQNLISQPQGSLIRRIDLQKALGLDRDTYKDIQGRVRDIGAAKLDLTKTYKDQKTLNVSAVVLEVYKEFDVLKKFDNGWPVKAFLVRWLRNRVSYRRGKPKQEARKGKAKTIDTHESEASREDDEPRSGAPDSDDVHDEDDDNELLDIERHAIQKKRPRNASVEDPDETQLVQTQTTGAGPSTGSKHYTKTNANGLSKQSLSLADFHTISAAARKSGPSSTAQPKASGSKPPVKKRVKSSSHKNR